MRTVYDQNKNRTGQNTAFLKWIYGAFLVVGIYFLCYGKPGESAVHFGIALAFDPFDSNQGWKERPTWQRAWLVIHLLVAFACLILQILMDYSLG